MAGHSAHRIRRGVRTTIVRGAILLAVIAAIGSAAYAGVRASQDPRFALREVEVGGCSRSSAADVLAAAALPQGSNIWLLDTASAVTRHRKLALDEVGLDLPRVAKPGERDGRRAPARSAARSLIGGLRGGAFRLGARCLTRRCTSLPSVPTIRAMRAAGDECDRAVRDIGLRRRRPFQNGCSGRILGLPSVASSGLTVRSVDHRQRDRHRRRDGGRSARALRRSGWTRAEGPALSPHRGEDRIAAERRVRRFAQRARADGAFQMMTRSREVRAHLECKAADDRGDLEGRSLRSCRRIIHRLWTVFEVVSGA